MVEYLRTILTAQFEAALCMAGDCLRKCPAEHWDSPVAKYPFWQVAYHALCFVDFYLSPGEQAFAPRPELHPRGLAEMDDEYPSRRFEREELLAYVTLCRQKVAAALAAETEESLQAWCASGGPWLALRPSLWSPPPAALAALRPVPAPMARPRPRRAAPRRLRSSTSMVPSWDKP